MCMKIKTEEIIVAPKPAINSGILRVSYRSDKYPETKLDIIQPANVNDAANAPCSALKPRAVLKNGIAHASTKTEDGKYNNAPTNPINHICGLFMMPHN